MDLRNDSTGATLAPARDNDNRPMHRPATALPGLLEDRLPLAMVRDAARLGARIDRARARRAPEAEWTRLAADLERSIASCAARAMSKPAITYPPDLPVAQRADEIARAIRAHQVVIVCGETGSGKTTQTMTTWCARIALAISSARCATGRSGG